MSTGRRGSLAQAVQADVGTAGAQVPRTPVQAPPAQQRKAEAEPRQPKSRDGKVKVSTYLSAEARQQLRKQAIGEGTSVEEILRSLINEYFQQRHLPRIA